MGKACKHGQFSCFWDKYNLPSCILRSVSSPARVGAILFLRSVTKCTMAAVQLFHVGSSREIFRWGCHGKRQSLSSTVYTALWMPCTSFTFYLHLYNQWLIYCDLILNNVFRLCTLHLEDIPLLSLNPCKYICRERENLKVSFSVVTQALKEGLFFLSVDITSLYEQSIF